MDTWPKEAAEPRVRTVVTEVLLSAADLVLLWNALSVIGTETVMPCVMLLVASDEKIVPGATTVMVCSGTVTLR